LYLGAFSLAPSAIEQHDLDQTTSAIAGFFIHIDIDIDIDIDTHRNIVKLFTAFCVPSYQEEKNFVPVESFSRYYYALQYGTFPANYYGGRHKKQRKVSVLPVTTF
jgi:hypothetical protein